MKTLEKKAENVLKKIICILTLFLFYFSFFLCGVYIVQWAGLTPGFTLSDHS